LKKNEKKSDNLRGGDFFLTHTVESLLTFRLVVRTTMTEPVQSLLSSVFNHFNLFWEDQKWLKTERNSEYNYYSSVTLVGVVKCKRVEDFLQQVCCSTDSCMCMTCTCEVCREHSVQFKHTAVLCDTSVVDGFSGMQLVNSMKRTAFRKLLNSRQKYQKEELSLSWKLDVFSMTRPDCSAQRMLMVWHHDLTAEIYTCLHWASGLLSSRIGLRIVALEYTGPWW